MTLVKNHWRLIIACAVIFIMENVSYFVVGTYWGQQWGLDKTTNLMLGIDAFFPWFTPLYLYYFIWPIAFFALLPALVWKAAGRRGVALYAVISVGMYIVGTYIYQVFPTTFSPMDFIDGTYATLPDTDPFYWLAMMLSSNVANVWGAFPSYHNFWASLLLLIPLFCLLQHRQKNKAWTYICMALGLLITLSTLLLHQHALMDIILTYLITLILYFIGSKTKLYEKAERWLFPAKL